MHHPLCLMFFSLPSIPLLHTFIERSDSLTKMRRLERIVAGTEDIEELFFLETGRSNSGIDWGGLQSDEIQRNRNNNTMYFLIPIRI